MTLPQYFKQHGYRTEAMGKIFHVGHGNHEDAASWSVPHWQAKSIAYALPESRATKGSRARRRCLPTKPADEAAARRGLRIGRRADNAYPDGGIADEAIARLRAAKEKPDEPFFLAVGFLKPHLPFCAPKKYWDLYDRAAFPLPEPRTPPDGRAGICAAARGELRQYTRHPGQAARSPTTCSAR